jgi:GNAT superfamily N-acetyltransferase
MDLLMFNLAARPDLAPMLDEFPGAWPEFMYFDQISPLFYDMLVAEYAEFCLIAVDRSAPRRPVAKALSVPFHWPGDPAVDLPAGGYDEVILRATRDRSAGRAPNLVSPIEIAVQPDLRGRGIAGTMLDELRRNTARLGFASLVAPVRPNRKHEHPDTTVAEYATWTRDDGLPVDPWLRVHVRAGARVVGMAPRSMIIGGTLDEWRRWTGLPFDTTGAVQVPEALATVHCDVREGYAVYVEPNVWVHHRL